MNRGYNAVLNDFGKLRLFYEDTEITMLVIFLLKLLPS